MDELEERIAELSERESLAALRPDLDGRAVMDRLGVKPGPVVGKALAFLMELRLEEGPLGEAEAGRRLDACGLSSSRPDLLLRISSPLRGSDPCQTRVRAKQRAQRSVAFFAGPDDEGPGHHGEGVAPPLAAGPRGQWFGLQNQIHPVAGPGQTMYRSAKVWR